MRDQNPSQSDRGYILVFKFWSHFRGVSLENVNGVSETALSTLTGNDVSQYWVSAKTKLGGCSTLHVECLCGVV